MPTGHSLVCPTSADEAKRADMKAMRPHMPPVSRREVDTSVAEIGRRIIRIAVLVPSWDGTAWGSAAKGNGSDQRCRRPIATVGAVRRSAARRAVARSIAGVAP